MSCNEWATTMRDNGSPKKECKECWGNDYSLDEEEDPKLLDRHTGKYGLDYPIEEEAKEPG